MHRTAEQRLQDLIVAEVDGLLTGGLIGLERESLRVGQDGGIAQTPHPSVFGSPLTNRYVTTDYSEALIELITPPMDDAAKATGFLADLSSYLYQRLDEELLWATSMPCVVAGESSIPIARYGSSNIGTMKHVYRRGLGHRYGHVMQVIAGVHFNYSIPEAFWPAFKDLEEDQATLQDFVSERYIGLIRNLQRCGWLVPYLFGCSPAVCKSFFADTPSGLSEFDRGTYYQPHATTLRVSDIGYQNKKEKKGGLRVCYDSLQSYVNSLLWAIETPHAPYEAIGVVVDGHYEQLNANILQIENEYYSTIRPKQLTGPNEKPALALRQRGVRYVELRSVDVSAFDPVGFSLDELRFLEAFLIYCLLEHSPAIDATEHDEIDHNLHTAAIRGREPGLRLRRQDRDVALRDWAMEICDGMSGICERLDRTRGGGAYTASLAAQIEAIRHPELTPSARMLQEMRDEGLGFFHYALLKSEGYREYFRGSPLSPEREEEFEGEADRSRRRQAEIESSDEVSFDEFLSAYFRQSA